MPSTPTPGAPTPSASRLLGQNVKPSSLNSSASTGASGSANASASSAKAAFSKSQEQILENIGSKLAGKGAKLSSAELNELAGILKTTPDKLANLTRKDFRELVSQFHPDKNGGEAIFNTIQQILNNLKCQHFAK